MNAKSIFTFIALICSFFAVEITAMAQNTPLADKNRLESLLQEATASTTRNFAKAVSISKEIIAEAEKHELPYYKSKAQLLICSMYNSGLHYDTLYQYCQSSMDYFLKQGDLENLAWGYNYIGIVTDLRGERPEALANFQKGYDLFTSIGNKKGEGYCLNDMGVTYGFEGNYIVALDYYLKALEIFEQEKDYDGLARTYTCLGYHSKTQFDKGRTEEYYLKGLNASTKANNLFWKAIAMSGYSKFLRHKGSFDSALTYNKELLKMCDTLQSDYVRIDAYSNQAFLLYDLKEKDKAEEYAKRTIDLMDRQNRFQNKGKIHNLIAQINLDRGDLSTARKHLMDVLNSPKSPNRTLAQTNRLLSNYYEQKQDYKNALFHQSAYTSLYDTIEQVDNTIALANIQNSYELGRKQSEIDLLSEQNNLQKQLLKNRINLMLLLVALAGVIIGGLIFAYQQKLSMNRTLEEKIKERTEDLINTNAKLEKSNEELKRFAYIASHDLKEPLRNISGFLRLIEKRKSNLSEESTSEFISIAKKSAIQMHELIEDVLEYSQLTESRVGERQVNMSAIVQQTIYNLQQSSQRKVKFVVGDLPKLQVLSSDMSRLFLNLIENGMKYNESKNPTIEIECEESAKEYCIFVKDNGIGIEKEFFDKIFEMFSRLHDRRQYQGSGIGLASCKKIMDKYKGGIYVQSKVGEGTTFILTFPKS